MNQNSDSPIEVADPFARRLLSQYLERRQTDLRRLRTALAAADFASIQLTGHNLFGSGAAYGLDEVSSIGAKLEQAAKSEQSDRIRVLVDELEQFVNNVTIT